MICETHRMRRSGVRSRCQRGGRTTAAVTVAALGFGFASGDAVGATHSGPNLPPVAVTRVAEPLYAVACTKASSCFALGDSDVFRLGARRWRVSLSSPFGSAGALGGVSCATANVCVLVGRDARGTRALRWAGTAWKALARPPLPRSVAIGSISCVSGAFCMAVGGTPTQPWSATLTGGVWKATPLSHLTGVLRSVACRSPTACTAVGQNFAGTAPLLLTWNGRVWSVAPAFPAGPTPNLQAIFCGSASDCWAGGDSGSASLLLHLAGGATASVFLSGASVFNGISCVALATCLAVGKSTGGAVDAHSIGKSWTLSKIDGFDPRTGAALNAVQCFADGRCLAVGQYGKAPTIRGFSVVIASSTSTA